MESRNKNVLIAGLISAVLIMAIGYAAFAQRLNINGTANITSTWDVHIEDIAAEDPVGTAKNISASVDSGNLTARFSAELSAPGDAITYTVTVRNSGTIAAKLTGIEFSDATPAADDVIIYTYSGLVTNSTIAAGASSTFTVTATYKNIASGQSQPASGKLNKNATISLTYAQA